MSTPATSDSASASGDSAASATGGKSAAKKLTNEQIVTGFNALRQEQRAMSQKVVEFESEANEHGLVIEALKAVDGERKCFRLIGGVLVERTVKEVLPPLEKNKEMLGQLVDSLKSSIVTKGKEINEYMDRHNIQIRGADRDEPPPVSTTKDDDGKSTAGGQGVLVGDST